MNALDSYLKANNGMERKIVITVLPRTVTEDAIFGETRTKTLEFDRLAVFADAGLQDAFAAIPGVMTVQVDKTCSVHYGMSIDPRYNTEWVMREIEAVAKTTVSEPTKKQEQPKTEMEKFIDFMHSQGGFVYPDDKDDTTWIPHL